MYLLKCNKAIEEYTFEDDEVSEVEQKVEGLLIHDEEYKILFETITKE